MITTKEQERKALEQIRKIVSGLGENSYIATAFEGCFEIAEENIENDFALSMKQRAESAEKKASEMEVKNERMRFAVKEAERNAKDLQKQIEARFLGADDLADVQQLIDGTIYDIDAQLKDAAGAIVKHAEDPTSPEFLQAVKDHRNLGSKLNHYKALNSRVIDVMKAGA